MMVKMLKQQVQKRKRLGERKSSVGQEEERVVTKVECGVNTDP